MLPYLRHPEWDLGPLTIHAFGVAVAVAMWYGLTFGQRRFERSGLDAAVGQRLGSWMLLGGFIGAHLFAILLYFPAKVREDPWVLLRVWEDISSFGGMIGGLISALVFFAIWMRDSTWQTRLRYLDAVAFVFPGALAIGRVGCALAHDHPGVVTSAPLAVSLESESARAFMHTVYSDAGLALPANVAQLGFHDLGLYEFLFLALIVVPLFAYWNRRARPTGFFIVAFAGLYLPVRFALDTLRVVDARYFGLTPAQWVAALVLTSLPLALAGRRKVSYAIAGAAILGTAWACWSGNP